MTITLSVVIMLVAYIFGAITKIFIDKLPNKYIPIQNVIIGIISGIICFYLNIDNNLLNSILIGIMSTMSAGGIADLIEVKKTNDNEIKG
ncbi:hypothetical protein EGR52_13440 [bacterium]|nr:hypothetical protein [bacterium]MBD8924371.1 hypothetical protein [bacterium]